MSTTVFDGEPGFFHILPGDEDTYALAAPFKNQEITGGTDEFKMLEIDHTRRK